MKKLLLIISIFATSCASTVKVGGQLTSYAVTDSSIEVGFVASAAAKWDSVTDRILKGKPVAIGTQVFTLEHTDSTVTINGNLYLKTK